jgi:hypothetical protein
MKTLNNYITERLNPKHLGHTAGKFPIEGTIDDMIKYLQGLGFGEFPDFPGTLGDYADFFDKENTKGYIVYKELNGKGLFFTNTTKSNISRINPGYYIYFIGNIPDKYKKVAGSQGRMVYTIPYKEFEKEIENYFQ